MLLERFRGIYKHHHVEISLHGCLSDIVYVDLVACQVVTNLSDDSNCIFSYDCDYCLVHLLAPICYIFLYFYQFTMFISRGNRKSEVSYVTCEDIVRYLLFDGFIRKLRIIILIREVTKGYML